jgi:hypothetical protein
MWNLPVERLTLYHLRSNTAVSCEPRSRQKLDEAINIVVSVAKSIAAGRFPATENQYCPCDFPEYCPYYKHKSGVSFPEGRLPEQLRNLDMTEVVEQYATLQDEQKLIEAKLTELKNLLIQYCNTQKLNRVFGKEHAITYKVIDRMAFDENKVKAILEPAGLWGKVLKFDPALAKALVESSNIPNDIKKKVISALKIISSYPQLSTKGRDEEKEE